MLPGPQCRQHRPTPGHDHCSGYYSSEDGLLTDVLNPTRRGFVKHYHPLGFAVDHPHRITLSHSERWLCAISDNSDGGYAADTLSARVRIDLSGGFSGGWRAGYEGGPAVAFNEHENEFVVVAAKGKLLRWCIPCKTFLGAVDTRGIDRGRHNLSHAWLSSDGSRVTWIPADSHGRGAIFCDRIAGGDFVWFGPDARDIEHVSASPDGRYVAVRTGLGNDGPLCIWRTRDGEVVLQDRRCMSKTNVSFGGSRSGYGVLAYGLGDGTVRIVRMCDLDSDL